LDKPNRRYKIGYLNAQFWPISVISPRQGDSQDESSDKKLYIPHFLLRFSPTKTIYHYTTDSGLFGIVKENAVFASHIRYMNDAEEVVHGQRLAVETLNRLAAKERFQGFRSVLSRCAKILEEIELPNYFVASFSKKSDDLSQWRAYGQDQGICIGFNLSDSLSYQHFYLPVQTLYKTSEKISLIVFHANLYFREFQIDLAIDSGDSLIKQPNVEDYANSFATKLRFEFIRFKHQSFEAEQEIRQVISSAESQKYRPEAYRVRGNVIVPYHRTSDRIMREKDGQEILPCKLPISSILIGPMRNQSLCAVSVRDFLKAHELSPDLVQMSQLPYRAH
jgi:hypothetical protein